MLIKDAIINISLTGKKLPQSEYLTEGQYPVVDQGKTLIGGYTDKNENIIKNILPVIVFGDHTKVIKYIDFNFVAGADGIKVLKSKYWLNPKLFYYYLRAIRLPDKGYARHFQFLLKANIPIPPLPEQKRIVKKLEELFKELDEGVETLKKMQEQLKQYRQSVLKHAFEGKLTENWRKKNKPEPASVLLEKIKEERKKKDKNYKELPPIDITTLPKLPTDWEWTRVGDIFNIETGSTPSTNNIEYWENGNIYWVTPKDLSYLKNPFISNTERKITQKGLKNCSTKIVPKNSIIISTRAPIGYIAILASEMCFNQGCKALVSNNNKLTPMLYYYYLLTTKVIEMNGLGSGSTFKEISKNSLSGICLPITSISEQQQIVKEIESRFAMADELEKTIEQSLEQADTLRQSILKSAFEGKLVPQDPNDESAEILLERIKKEKNHGDSSLRSE
ncbi:MAG: restriction endonuclease subunit S [Elusimicrobiota bacterium]